MKLFRKFVNNSKPPFTTTLIEKFTQAAGTFDAGTIEIDTGEFGFLNVGLCRLNLIIEGGIPGAIYTHELSVIDTPPGFTTYHFINPAQLPILTGLNAARFFVNALDLELDVEHSVTVRCTTTDNYGRTVISDIVITFTLTEGEEPPDTTYKIKLTAQDDFNGYFDILNIPASTTSLNVRFTFSELGISKAPTSVTLTMSGMSPVTFDTSGVPTNVQTRSIPTPGPVNSITGLKDKYGSYYSSVPVGATLTMQVQIISAPTPSSPNHVSSLTITN
jgi:hypothetical protein